MSEIAEGFELVADGLDTASDAADWHLLALLAALGVLVAARLFLGYRRGGLARGLARSDASPFAQAVVQRIVSVSVYVLARCVVLAIFGASWAGILTFFSVTSFAVARSTQDILRNLVAGLYMIPERPFAPGETIRETIRVKDVEGGIEHISLRTTRLSAEDDEIVMVPNAVLSSEVVFAPPRPTVERLAVELSGVPGPLVEINPAIRGALTALPGVRPPCPRVQLRRATVDGSDVRMMLWQDPMQNGVPVVQDRQRTCFPTCDLVVDGG